MVEMKTTWEVQLRAYVFFTVFEQNLLTTESGWCLIPDVQKGDRSSSVSGYPVQTKNAHQLKGCKYLEAFPWGCTRLCISLCLLNVGNTWTSRMTKYFSIQESKDFKTIFVQPDVFNFYIHFLVTEECKRFNRKCLLYIVMDTEV